ncbi:Protein required for attachment to host cells (plasmid) [Legionella adelaidensis]|uniref:Protein required for attachment to host cells n=1 Tax=Legionella adelaidensis TaxID=45056 RepID=A0A0W0R201_9GAMM|nr:host attachment protein [Legionella adelaidensis]KTC65003.1 hypothetical protein Lade_1683 [Legionella adelaidensis]VEH85317.1 Protein required for attachment to host cells [Legionella adelaidensis]
MKWIVAANTNCCHIYNYDSKPKKLNLIKEIYHPENKLKASQINSDKPGHFQTSAHVRGAYPLTTNPEQVYIDRFAKEVADDLNEARNDHSYDELIIVMPAQMEGRFLQHLNKNVKELITSFIQKNIMNLSDQELLEYVTDKLKKW